MLSAMTAINGSRIVIIERKEESQQDNVSQNLGKENFVITLAKEYYEFFFSIKTS